MTEHELAHVVGTVLTVEEANDLLRSVQGLLHRLHAAATDPQPLLAEALGEGRFELLQDVVDRGPRFAQAARGEPHFAEATPLRQRLREGAARGERLDLSDVTAVRNLLHELQLFLMGLPVMVLVLPFDPRHAFMTDVRQYLADHGPGVLKLEVRVDVSLVGGAVVEWGGRIFDYSLRTTLSDEAIRERL